MKDTKKVTKVEKKMNFVVGKCPNCGGSHISYVGHRHTQTDFYKLNSESENIHEPEEDYYECRCLDCETKFKEVRVVLFHHNEVVKELQRFR